jgi:hypothetical protein
MNLKKKEYCMKKKNRDQKKLQLVKEKITTLTIDQIELVKGGGEAYKTIVVTSGGAGCTNNPTSK